MLSKPRENSERWYRVVDSAEGKRELLHKVICERVLGKKLPKGAVVHHVDNNPLNNRTNNLVICEDVAYHHLLHRNIRLRAAGADWTKERICSTCNKVLPITSFYPSFRQHMGHPCKSCAVLLCKAKRATGYIPPSRQKKEIE